MKLHLSTICAVFLLPSLLQAAEIWEPRPAHPGAPIATRNVRIVKQGMETHRNDEGSMWTISAMHRYRVVTNQATGLLDASFARQDLQLFHDCDVDGDGSMADDVVEAHVFSMDRTLSPDMPFYDTSIGTHRMLGGTAIYTADADDPNDPQGYSEDGMNDYEEGPAYQPRRNWTLFNEVYALYSPFRMYGVWLWKKDDFLNGGADFPVRFDTNSVLAHLVMRYWMGIEGFRWVVRNNDQFYISEEIYRYAGDPPGSVGGKVHQLVPGATRWAEYFPGVAKPYDIAFDTNTAVYATREFTNVTAVGYYLFKDQLISGYVGHKWYTFEARAVVQCPQRPSEHIDMVPVAGASGVQDFYLSTCEVPYTLWRKVYRQADNNCFCLVHSTANFDNDADMGSMDFPPSGGMYGPHGPNEPATDLCIYDVIIWCNALSFQESREPCYYTDAAFTQPFMKAHHCPFWLDAPTALPDIHVKWAADGYRLPTPKEWQRAAQAGAQQFSSTYGWIAANASNTTHAVGMLATNTLGCYDVSGNVWELTWPFGSVLDPQGAEPLMVLGGGFNYPSHPTNHSASAYGDRPYDGNHNIGLRLVRRDAGHAAPDTGTNVAASIPQWVIEENAITKPDPARQLVAPLSNTWLALGDVPGREYDVGLTEVTFAQWQPVYDWAVANGYMFDYDGDMGSMAYWGWGPSWTPGTHGPDEPVTGMTRFDAITWLNALSALEGRDPVYHTDDSLATPITSSYIYRPLQRTFAEADGLNILAWNLMLAWPGYGIDPAADGYRLPDDDEFYYVSKAGNTSRTYPWGNNIQLAPQYAWIIDNSSLRTQPVGRLKTNEWGFADVMGNVSEMSEAEGGKLKGLSKIRQGLSFLDLADGYPKTADRGTWSGRIYPDVGLRVLQQSGSAGAPPEKIDDGTTPTTVVNALTYDPADFDNLDGLVHRGGLGRAGVFSAPTLASFKEEKWKFQTAGPVKSSPVIVDDVVYVGSYDGCVYALDLATGAPIWSNQTGGRVSGSAAVVSNMVFIANENGYLFALNATNGSVVWSTQMSTWAPAGSPAVAYGTVFMGAGSQGGSRTLFMSSRHIYAYDMYTGAQVWRSSATGPQGFAGIAMDADRIYAGIGGSSYGAVNVGTGAQLWRKSEGHQNRQFMSMSVVDGTVYIPGSMRGSVSAYTPAGGQKWLSTTIAHNDDEGHFEMNSGGFFGHEIFTDLAIAHGCVYAGCNDGRLCTFDQSTGARGWSFDAGAPVQSSPAIAGNAVYFGCHSGTFFAVDATTGTKLWEHQLGGRIISSPWPVDTMIVVGCDDGGVYALEGVPEPLAALPLCATVCALLRAR